MAHAYSRITIHIVFATKGRKNLIPENRQQELWSYITGIARNKGIPLLAVGGMPNHLHVLAGLPAGMDVPKLVNVIKANSSRFMRRTNKAFWWQQGYGAFAVCHSHADTVIRYIRNQKEHHRKRSFEDEFLVMLRKSGLEFDPVTVFD
jgi:putative transposase